MPHALNTLSSTVATVVAPEDLARASVEKQLFNVHEVAAYLGISTSSVWRHVKSKGLPAPIRIGGSTRWKRSDLEVFLEAAKTKRDVA